MADTGGSDLSDIQAHVFSLRSRVEELERQNESFRLLISRCRCSQENIQFPADSWISCQGKLQEANKSEVVDKTETLKGESSYFYHDPTTPSSKPVEEVQTSCTELFVDHTMLMKCETRPEPGFQESTRHHARRYVALKIMYFGQRWFYGFASEAQMDPTIESEIFKALERTKLLVGTKEDWKYSRCGRTDKGVSSSGQVISLYLRSNLKDTEVNTENRNTNLIEKCEVDYVKVLNRVLPPDVRVVGWSPVPTDFHSRFSCLGREYQYLFWKGNLDIKAMQQAAKKFIGEYDFRNFCKMDAANVNNYKRKITFFDISSLDKRYLGDELWAMTVNGSAFLWHQVRCMVAVLFMIGQGLESPDVIDALLDIKRISRKPQYNMAPELPLILRLCEFGDLKFICSSDARRALYGHLKSEIQRYMLHAAIFHDALNRLSPLEQNSEFLRKGKGHIPLLLRITEPSYEERRAKLHVRARNKR